MIATETHTYHTLLVAVEESIAEVTMNRPERRNALSVEHMEELIACFTAIGRSREVAVAILRGNGPAFCAGHDLREMMDRDVAFYQRLFDVCTELMQSIQSIPQPVIAQVHGMATAAGCQLVATCDLAVAAEEATFCTPGVNIGLFCSTPMVALSRNVSRKRAMEMLLLGELLPAREAAEYGLVNRVVPAGRLMDEAMALADRIASKPPATLAIGKEAFYRQIEMDLAEAYDYAAGVMVRNMMDAESEEGIGAFLEKRAPVWDKG